jgi:hypothetical protein
MQINCLSVRYWQICFVTFLSLKRSLFPRISQWRAEHQLPLVINTLSLPQFNRQHCCTQPGGLRFWLTTRYVLIRWYQYTRPLHVINHATLWIFISVNTADITKGVICASSKNFHFVRGKPVYQEFWEFVWSPFGSKSKGSVLNPSAQRQCKYAVLK